MIDRLKPNFVFVVIVLFGVGWLYTKTLLGLVGTSAALLNDLATPETAAIAAAAGTAREHVNSILLTAIGLHGLMAIIAGLVMAMGKLLDEKPEVPMVPASTHDAALELLAKKTPPPPENPK